MLMHIVMDDVFRSGWWVEENFAPSPQPQLSAKFATDDEVLMPSGRTSDQTAHIEDGVLASPSCLGVASRLSPHLLAARSRARECVGRSYGDGEKDRSEQQQSDRLHKQRILMALKKC